YLSDKARKRVAILAHRLKLVSDDDFGSRVAVDWAKAIGKQLIVEVIEEDFETKNGTKAKRSKLSFAGFWGLDDPRVQDVPRDTAAQRNAAWSGNQPPKPPAKVAPAAKSDDWGDI